MLRFISTFLLVTSCVSAQSAVLEGSVMDGSGGVPLEGATVTLRDAGLVATTDAGGHFHFDGGASKQKGEPSALSKAAVAELITFSKEGYGSVSRSVKSAGGSAGGIAGGVENVVLTRAGKVTYVCTTADGKGRWQIARTVFDPKTRTSQITYLTDSALWNFKPNFSPDGKRMTFFRRYAVNGPCCETWRSAVCVMNADGSGFHELLEGTESFNTEPYWARDGSNRISFNRMNVPDAGPFWTDADGQPGDEQRIAPWGWINPHLADGRVFMQRGGASYLATPLGDGKAKYVQIKRPDNKFIHKIALSQDQTMIAYQKWVDRGQDMYKGGVMVYAKFDASIPAITDEVIFDDVLPARMAWYVSISTDNRFLLYARDGAIMQHDMKTGTTMKVSADSDPYKAYPTYTTFSK